MEFADLTINLALMALTWAGTKFGWDGVLFELVKKGLLKLQAMLKAKNEDKTPPTSNTGT